MKKSDIAAMLYDSIEITKSGAEDLVNDMFDTFAKTLEKGEDVEIAGFGKFVTARRAARTARNPQTGEEIKVAARNVVKFKPSKTLKDRVK